MDSGIKLKIRLTGKRISGQPFLANSNIFRAKKLL